MQLFMKIPSGEGSCPEWTIIELQGDLETKSQASSLSGKFIGDLFFTHNNQPVLIIGHHILYGKLINMEKPLAVLAKNPDSKHLHHNDEVAMDTDDTQSDVTNMHYFVKAIVKRKMLFKTRPKPIIANVPKKL